MVIIVYQSVLVLLVVFFFFFNDTATTEIYTLSLHDALPISCGESGSTEKNSRQRVWALDLSLACKFGRSEEHTSELQSQSNLVCRLLLEKKNPTNTTTVPPDATTSHSSPYRHAIVHAPSHVA